MRKMLACVVLLLVVLTGCTENQRVRALGGAAKMTLPAGQKLVQVTWKDVNLWYLTRPMKAGETAETYTFQEKSNLGMMEGKFIITEVMATDK